MICAQTIVQYIVDKHKGTGPSLEASTPEKRALANQATRFLDLYILSIFVSATTSQLALASALHCIAFICKSIPCCMGFTMQSGIVQPCTQVSDSPKAMYTMPPIPPIFINDRN